MAGMRPWMEQMKDSQVIEDELLGEVRFVFLTLAETQAIEKEYADLKERTMRLMHRMVEKADPSVTWEKWQAVPDPVVGRVIELLSTRMRDFRVKPPKASP